ncbi:MAG: hypothetical protein MPN21_09885 [Thermoanaerobaculia bacterium]|nr:hypothetical protein [Thermoanaerobaculia bacterium]
MLSTFISLFFPQFYPDHEVSVIESRPEWYARVDLFDEDDRVTHCSIRALDDAPDRFLATCTREGQSRSRALRIANGQLVDVASELFPRDEILDYLADWLDASDIDWLLQDDEGTSRFYRHLVFSVPILGNGVDVAIETLGFPMITTPDVSMFWSPKAGRFVFHEGPESVSEIEVSYSDGRVVVNGSPMFYWKGVGGPSLEERRDLDGHVQQIVYVGELGSHPHEIVLSELDNLPHASIRFQHRGKTQSGRTPVLLLEIKARYQLFELHAKDDAEARRQVERLVRQHAPQLAGDH